MEADTPRPLCTPCALSLGTVFNSCPKRFRPALGFSSSRWADVDAADGAVLVLYAVAGVDTVKNILNGIHGRVLALCKGKTLVSHALQGNDLAGYFFLTEFFAGDVFILRMIRAIHATVDAVV